MNSQATPGNTTHPFRQSPVLNPFQLQMQRLNTTRNLLGFRRGDPEEDPTGFPGHWKGGDRKPGVFHVQLIPEGGLEELQEVLRTDDAGPARRTVPRRQEVQRHVERPRLQAGPKAERPFGVEWYKSGERQSLVWYEMYFLKYSFLDLAVLSFK